jgi:hypothetical protein
MIKKIEIVPVSDPHSLKERLEEMVNEGWEIKGFVNCNSGNNYNEPYAVLQRFSEKETGRKQETETEKPAFEHSPFPDPPKKKEISISLGGN